MNFVPLSVGKWNCLYIINEIYTLKLLVNQLKFSLASV